MTVTGVVNSDSVTAKTAEELKEIGQAAYDAGYTVYGLALGAVASNPDQDAADAVIALIDAIGEVVLTDECKAEIDAARNAYDALTDAQKALVNNYETLQLAEGQYAALQLEADMTAFEAYKTAKKSAMDALLQEGDSEAVQSIVGLAKTQIEGFTYDESKTLDENKAALDTLVANVPNAVAEQRAADRLAADKAAFDAYKAEKRAAVEAMAEEGDSEAAQKIIADAAAAIGALTYDEAKTLDGNKAAVDAPADIADALAEQRAADKLPAIVVTAPAANTLTYSGQAQTLVTAGEAKDGTMQYALGTKDAATGEYSATVPTGTDAGTYHVWYKVAGDGNHEDSEPACVAASIGRADLSGAEVELAKSSYVCDGKAKEPKVRSVVLNGRKLKAGKDFSVSYKGNTKVGTATVTITGTGNYEGTAEATFSIVLAKVKGLTTAGHPAKGTLDVAWEASAGAKTYQLSWRKAGGSWKSRTVKGTSAAIEGLRAGGCYEVRVRARAGSAAGAWSKVAGRWLRKASSLKAAAGKAKGTVRVSWAADAQATGGYVAYACAKKDGAIVAKAAVAAGRTSATLKGLKSGKAYYVKVRPLREVSGTTYVGVQRYCKATVEAK